LIIEMSPSQPADARVVGRSPGLDRRHSRTANSHKTDFCNIRTTQSRRRREAEASVAHAESTTLEHHHIPKRGNQRLGTPATRAERTVAWILLERLCREASSKTSRTR
jgi:hypothetical protein